MSIRISKFLDRFKNITPPNYLIKKYLLEIIYSLLNIKINKDNIKINGFIIYISEKPIIKNEIFFKKELIIKKLNNQLNSNIKDIK